MKIPQLIKKSGRCYLVDSDTVTVSKFVIGKVQCDEESTVSDFSLIKQDGVDGYKVSFQTGESKNYAGGVIKGFLYPSGKFSGKGFYEDEPDVNEGWSGMFSLKQKELFLKGDLYIDNELMYRFLIKVFLQDPVLGEPLNQTLINKLLKLSTNLQATKKNISFYPKAISLKLKPDTEKDLYVGMCIAYSWMPTMLDIYTDGTNSLEDYIPLVQRFSSIKKQKDLIKNETTIKQDLVVLSKLVNNSMVGTSKMLHLFFPKYVPIIDSRVLVGWNEFFKIHYLNHPDLKLPTTFPARIEAQVEIYFLYWKMLLKWIEATEKSSLRDIEESFYWIGKHANV